MKLKELLAVMRPGTNVCVCDDMGPSNDTCPIEKLPYLSIMSDLDREIDDIYLDPDDMSITVELVSRDFNKEE